MRHELICVNWTQQALTDAQHLVLREVAVQVLKNDRKLMVADFSHELLEGRLIRKNDGLFVTFAGTFFHADLGLVRGERWSVDFLIPARSEHIVLDEKSIMLTYRPAPSGRTVSQVEQIPKVGEVSLLN